ncbi:MAG: GAF domain-containing protein [Actinomycetota bacterium]
MISERAELFERLSRIERSISHRAPLKEVLDSITGGARELLGSDVVSVRLLDPDDPSYTTMVSYSGLPREAVKVARRIEIRHGVSGQAIREDRLVVRDHYPEAPTAIPAFVKAGVKAVMAAPVHEEDRVAGSLVVGSFDPQRRFDEDEQEVLMAFAEHVSLALTDAKTVEAMREAQRSKEMFLAMVSHELKTPLTVVMAALYTIKKHANIPEEMRLRILDSALDRGRELERLINRLLQGARAQLAAEHQEVSLSVVLHEAVKGFESARELHVGEIPEVSLELDPVAVQELLGILLENAVSHSPPDSEVHIESRLERERVSLTVINEGSLPADLDPSTLFLPFHRGEGARSSGVGLGLYIAARLTETIGGEIGVDSDDHGVRFTLKLPCDTSAVRAPTHT